MASQDVVFPENGRSFSADNTACAKHFAVAETEVVLVHVRRPGRSVPIEVGERWFRLHPRDHAVARSVTEKMSVNVRLADRNVESDVRDKREEIVATRSEVFVSVVEVQLVDDFT